jgi:hypothetical protein
MQVSVLGTSMTPTSKLLGIVIAERNLPREFDRSGFIPRANLGEMDDAWECAAEKW